MGVVVAVEVVSVGVGADVVGKVRSVRLTQKALNSEAPNDSVSQVPENEVKWGRLPPTNVLTITKPALVCIGTTQFMHCCISVSPSAVQKQDIKA